MVYSDGKVNVASYSFVVATKAAKIKKFTVVLNKRFVFAFWTIRQFNVSQAQRRFYVCHNVTVLFQSTPGEPGDREPWNRISLLQFDSPERKLP